MPPTQIGRGLFPRDSKTPPTVVLFQRAMGIVGIGRLDHQLPLPPHLIVLLQIPVGLFKRLRPCYTQTFDQPILGRLKIPFHAPFGLQGVIIPHLPSASGFASAANLAVMVLDENNAT